MTSPLRSLQPAASKEESSTKSDDDHAVPGLSHKRKRAPLTLVACLNCREKKTKCDGKKPFCGACTKRRNSDCRYEHLTEAQALREKNAALAQEVERLKTQALGWPVDVEQSSAFDQTSIEANLFWGQPMSSPQPLQDTLNAQSQQVLELQNELFGLKSLLPTLVCSRDRVAALRLVEEIQTNGVTDEVRAQADEMLRNALDSTMLRPGPTDLQSRDLQSGSLAGSSSISDRESMFGSNGQSSRTESIEKYGNSPFDPFIAWEGLISENNPSPGKEAR